MTAWQVLYDSGNRDLSAYTLTQFSLQGGRSDLFGDFEPWSCTIEYLHNYSGAIQPHEFRIGVDLEILWLEDPTDNTAAVLRRFIGVITDIDITRDTIRFIATSDLFNRLGNLEVGIPELSGDLGTVLDDAWDNYIEPVYGAPPFGVDTVFSGSVEVFSPADTYNAGEWLLQMARSDFGQIAFEQFGDPGDPAQIVIIDLPNTARTNTTLTGDEILYDGWEIVQRTDDNQNTATINGYEFTVVYQLPGTGQTYETVIETYLARTTDAQRIATQTVAPYAAGPMRRLERLTIPLATLDVTRRIELMEDLTIGQEITIPQLLPQMPTRFTITGYDETAGPGVHTLELYVADSRIFDSIERWNEVDPALEYATMDQTLTWADLITTEVA